MHLVPGTAWLEVMAKMEEREGALHNTKASGHMSKYMCMFSKQHTAYKQQHGHHRDERPNKLV